MKKLVLGFLPVLFALAIKAQPVFTYGKKSVSKDEFLHAFNKNPNAITDRKKAIKDYLDLYINFKLKVQAAYDAKLDEDPNQKFELENFKRQIAENIINEEAKVSDLVKEAFQRSQKDVHVAQVFVEVPVGSDTTEAYKKIQAAYKALKDGRDFSKVTQEFSTDNYTKQNSGDLGFVTVFTLPYEFENVVYSLRNGNFSTPFKSKLGYHIFKNVGERKALGTRRVAQILFAVPPGATDAQRNKVAVTADSVYNLIKKGASFEAMVKEFSNDMNSASNNGLLPEFGIGEYNPEFEKAAFALRSPNEISTPVASNYGYHIIKLIEAKPVATNPDDAAYSAYLKEKILKDERLVQAKKVLSNKHLSLVKYKPATYKAEDVWRYTDSFLANKNTSAIDHVTDNTILFSFAKQNIKVGDWLKFVKAMKVMPNEMSQKSYPDLMKEYVKITGEEYYKNHLEDYSPQYVQQVNEFKDANLLFGIMDKNVWSKANVDTNGLKDYYAKNKTKYQWSQSADALIINCADKDMALEVQQKLKSHPTDWRKIVEEYGTKVNADSGRYELSQLPVVDKTNLTAGLATSPVKNQTDETFTFNYIFKVYDKTDQRSFEDARGMVISDYQQVLEDRWLAQLKKKYPVKVNEAVINNLK